MANADKPFGFRPAYTLHGGPPSVGVYSNTSVAIYPGDYVTLDGSGCVASVAANGQGMGVAANYVSATSEQDVYVYNDLKNTIFMVQADGADLTSHAMVGLFYDITFTTGNTTTLKSLQELDSDQQTDDYLELMGLVDRPDNDWGGYCDVYVRFHVDSQIQLIADNT